MFKKWTMDEDKILRECFDQSMPMTKMVHYLPGRSREAIKHRRSYLGLVFKEKPRIATQWTPAEDEILRRASAEKWPASQIAAAFPTRTLNGVYHHASKIGVRGLDVSSRNDGHMKKPMPYDEVNANWAERKCLTCGVMFRSWGVGNRLCANHRSMSLGIG